MSLEPKTLEIPFDAGDQLHLSKFLHEVALTLRILQQRLDDLASRLEKLEQDRASSPGWYVDEGS